MLENSFAHNLSTIKPLILVVINRVIHIINNFDCPQKNIFPDISTHKITIDKTLRKCYAQYKERESLGLA